MKDIISCHLAMFFMFLSSEILNAAVRFSLPPRRHYPIVVIKSERIVGQALETDSLVKFEEFLKHCGIYTLAEDISGKESLIRYPTHAGLKPKRIYNFPHPQ